MIEDAVRIVMNIIEQDLSERLRQQGHNNTGALISSMDYRIKETAHTLVASFELNNYWYWVNYGVSATRIPYRPGSGAKQSKYITALISYFESKGLGRVTAKRAAFATATMHKRDGMPTRASSRFSKDGNRTGFLTGYLDQSGDTVHSILYSGIEDELNKSLNEIIENVQHGK